MAGTRDTISDTCDEPSLEELVASVREGDDAAFAVLRSRYRRKLQAILDAGLPPPLRGQECRGRLVKAVDATLGRRLRHGFEAGEEDVEAALDRLLVHTGWRMIFDALWEPRSQQVARVIRHCLPDRLADQTDDVLCRTWCVAARKYPIFQWRDEQRFVAWLNEIANRQVWDCAKRTKQKVLLVPMDDIPELSGNSDERPDRTLQIRERLQRLNDALMELSDVEQTAIRLYYFEYKSIAETAEVIEKTYTATRSVLDRARGRLRKMLGDSFLHSGSK
jgi:RNA polymerase sigma factor (sigma-70 family)